MSEQALFFEEVTGKHEEKDNNVNTLILSSESCSSENEEIFKQIESGNIDREFIFKSFKGLGEGGVELVQTRHLTHFSTPLISIYILPLYKFIGADEMSKTTHAEVIEWIKEEQSKHRLCACGCGREIQIRKSHRWNGVPQYIIGHQHIRKHNRQKSIELDEWLKAEQTKSHLCTCGCGQEIIIRREHNQKGIPRFIKNHGNRRGATKNELLKDYDYMFQKYSIDKLSSCTIGKILNCSSHTVLRHLKQLGIHIRSNNETKEGVAFTEDHKKQIGDANRGRTHTIEARNNMSAAHIGQIPSFETRRKRSITLQGIAEEEWDGFVSDEPYCEKFDEKFKEKIRKKFGRVCFLCPRTEEGNIWGRYHYKLSVHHVNYDRDCLCNGQKCFFVPLCLPCHGRTNGNRDYWQTFIIEKMRKEGYL